MFFIRQCVTTWMMYLVTTLLCGTAAWIVWAAVRRLLRGRGSKDVFRAAGWMAEWLYVLPVVHVGWEIYTLTATEFYLFFGRVTRTIENVLLALAAAWLIGFLWAVVRGLSGAYRQARLCGTCVPCTGERAELFRRACWRSGIAGEILSYEGEGVTEPFLRGIFVRRMYLPTGEMTQEEMQRRLKDYRWGGRCLAAVERYACLIHWYNPLVGILCRRMAADAGEKAEEETCGGVFGRICIVPVLALQIAFAGFCALRFLEVYTWLDTRTSDVVEMEGEESASPEEYVAERREEGGAVYLMRTYFVRRLTARECWRLMDFSDSDYEKAEAVNSQSQLYREAGNSIVKNVLMAVFGQMLPGKEAAYNGRK